MNRQAMEREIWDFLGSQLLDADTDELLGYMGLGPRGVTDTAKARWGRAIERVAGSCLHRAGARAADRGST